jgi:hypothetical protein
MSISEKALINYPITITWNSPKSMVTNLTFRQKSIEHKQLGIHFLKGSVSTTTPHLDENSWFLRNWNTTLYCQYFPDIESYLFSAEEFQKLILN